MIPRFFDSGWNAFKAFGRHASGAAGVELAITLPFLAFGAILTYDYGNGVYWHMQLDAATRSGAQFAMDYHEDNVAMEAVVLATTKLDPADVAVTISEFCECSFGAQLTCGSTCAGGDEPQKFTSIQITHDVETLLAPSYTVSGETVIRVE